ncbi:MAG: hypothetical protein ACYTFY_14115 [Planctomycetota bacterium]|jgi:DNA-binding NtrC family response regulator
MYDIIEVDDDPDIRNFLAGIFDNLEWETAIFKSSLETIEEINKNGTKVVILDLNPADFTCVLNKPMIVSKLTEVLTHYLALVKYKL